MKLKLLTESGNKEHTAVDATLIPHLCQQLKVVTHDTTIIAIMEDAITTHKSATRRQAAHRNPQYPQLSLSKNFLQVTKRTPGEIQKHPNPLHQCQPHLPLDVRRTLEKRNRGLNEWKSIKQDFKPKRSRPFTVMFYIGKVFFEQLLQSNINIGTF